MKHHALFVLLFSVTVLAQNPHTSTGSLKRLLAQQGFTGALEGKITIKRLGIFHCGSRQLEVFYHTWEESNPPGRAIHAAYRVVLLENGSRYVGSYKVQDPPAKIARAAIFFDYPKDAGNVIACDDNSLPESVVLNGEGADLFK